MISETVDAIILGAGIAGLSVADALIKRNKTCVLVDHQSSGSGSSGAPMMMINPATGRRAKRAWRAEICYKFIEELLEETQQSSPNKFYEKNGVIRPALTNKIAKNFKESITKYNWPVGWVKWLEQESFEKKFPFLSEQFGGLIIEKGMTVIGKRFIPSLSEYLAHKGLKTFFDKKYRLQNHDNLWNLEINNSCINSKTVIDATGYHQTKNSLWDFLSLHPIKGQTATFHYKEPIPVKSSISSLGYMAVFSSRPNEITVGSTYEHHFNHTSPDKEGLSYLKKKLTKTLPQLSSSYISVDQWSGVRVTVQDKKPVIGPHPDISGLYIIGALGSKGLLMGRYMADLLTNHILNGVEIDKQVSIERFLS